MLPPVHLHPINVVVFNDPKKSNLVAGFVLRCFQGGISLLSPEYLLSFERCPFHTETPDHYALVSYLIDL